MHAPAASTAHTHSHPLAAAPAHASTPSDDHIHPHARTYCMPSLPALLLGMRPIFPAISQNAPPAPPARPFSCLHSAAALASHARAAMAASAWQFLLQQGDEAVRQQVTELSPAQVRRVLHAFADGLVDIASHSGTASAASSQSSQPAPAPAPAAPPASDSWLQILALSCLPLGVVPMS